jgi:hypothetical protein
MVINEEKGYGFYFGPGILFLEFKVPMTVDAVQDAYDEVRKSFPNTEIKVVAYKNILGYWAAYIVKTGKSIYCGTMSLKTTKEQIAKHLENEKY